MLRVERIPNLSAEQSDGITVFRISTMTSLMLHRCRTGSISLQSIAQTTTSTVVMIVIEPSSSFVPISLQHDVIVVHRSGLHKFTIRLSYVNTQSVCVLGVTHRRELHNFEHPECEGQVDDDHDQQTEDQQLRNLFSPTKCYFENDERDSKRSENDETRLERQIQLTQRARAAVSFVHLWNTLHVKHMEVVQLHTDWYCGYKCHAHRPGISEDNTERIWISFLRSPQKSLRRASHELQIPHTTTHKSFRKRLRW
ncbi:hypothetical protein ANN_08462 [Periplaneta americana]|uniref:Uncharacterized protein n=1 Tax=Periplaneta americana TaxID=6978 RepID=A0ABQ8T1I3_PERAM|nr:hypothetical protein ANN_08462 [Periplaneta americana]